MGLVTLAIGFFNLVKAFIPVGVNLGKPCRGKAPYNLGMPSKGRDFILSTDDVESSNKSAEKFHRNIIHKTSKFLTGYPIH